MNPCHSVNTLNGVTDFIMRLMYLTLKSLTPEIMEVTIRDNSKKTPTWPRVFNPMLVFEWRRGKRNGELKPAQTKTSELSQNASADYDPDWRFSTSGRWCQRRLNLRVGLYVGQSSWTCLNLELKSGYLLLRVKVRGIEIKSSSGPKHKTLLNIFS